MEESKFKPLENWLSQVKESDCDNYIAIASNKENKCFGSCKSELDALATMLLNASHQDENIARTIAAVATILVHEAKEKGGRQ